MKYFTTFFDKNYLSKGIVLYNSLNKNCQKFKLYILCLDIETYDFFENNKDTFENVKLIQLFEIEEKNEELILIKQERSLIEYYFTLSPFLPLYILKNYDVPHICSLDADIKFYSDPDFIFSFLENYSIIVTPHKFSIQNKELIKYGKFNVSFQIFKNDEIGLNCLNRWKEKCIDWCKDYYDEVNDRFADQKYLDDWNIIYNENLKILDDNVSGLAVWNINNYILKKNNGIYFSSNERIVFYHFHNTKALNKRWITNGFSSYKVKPNKVITNLYSDYWSEIIFVSSKYVLNENKNIREKLIKDLKYNLFRQNTLFLNLYKGRLISFNLSKMNVILRKIVIKIYGKGI